MRITGQMEQPQMARALSKYQKVAQEAASRIEANVVDTINAPDCGGSGHKFGLFFLKLYRQKGRYVIGCHCCCSLLIIKYGVFMGLFRLKLVLGGCNPVVSRLFFDSEVYG